MSRTTVILVLHGKKKEGVGDPGHTQIGLEQVASLRQFLPEGKPPAVAVGVGRRHREVAERLGLRVTHWCPDFGGPQFLEPDKKHVRLADNTIIDFEQLHYSPMVDAAIVALLGSLPDGTVVCTGRPIARSLRSFGVDPKAFPSASIWRFVIEGGKIVKHTKLGQASDDVGGKNKEV